MGKKHTQEYIVQKLAERGYTLLSPYINSRIKLQCRCEEGHEFSIYWGDFNTKGLGCYYCGGSRLSHSFVKQAFKDKGLRLLTNNYVNNMQWLEYECEFGHRNFIRYIHFRKWDFKCPECASLKGRKVDSRYIAAFFKVSGWELEDNYTKNNIPMECICPNGHINFKTWASFRQSQVCFECEGWNSELNIDIVRAFLSDQGYELLSDIYINSSEVNLVYRCPEGHIAITSWNNFQAGRRCRECAIIALTGSNNPNWVENKEYCYIWRDQTFKYSIKERDGHICNNPYCYGGNPRLVVHHIDYDKFNCHPSNLITVCSSCNVRAETEEYKDWHKEWYRAVLSKKYNYNY